MARAEMRSTRASRRSGTGRAVPLTVSGAGVFAWGRRKNTNKNIMLRADHGAARLDILRDFSYRLCHAGRGGQAVTGRSPVRCGKLLSCGDHSRMRSGLHDFDYPGGPGFPDGRSASVAGGFDSRAAADGRRAEAADRGRGKCGPCGWRPAGGAGGTSDPVLPEGGGVFCRTARKTGGNRAGGLCARPAQGST